MDIADRVLGVCTLDEASLSRIYRHYTNAGEKPFAILTAYLGDKTNKKNKARLSRLKALLQKEGYSFIRVDGEWVEGGKTYKEKSLFVLGLTLKKLKKLLDTFNQVAGIYAGPETKGKVYLVFPDGETISLGKFHPGVFDVGMSKIKGKPFHFK